jgi:Domain of unknown function (DUF4189)
MSAARARVGSIAAAAAGLVVAAVLTAAPAAAQYYGAIGYSPSSGAMGWSFDYLTREEARQVALTRCAEHASDCEIAVQFADGCGVIVFGERAKSAAGSPSRSEATRVALRRCQMRSEGCTVRRWVCTTRSMY